MSGGDGRLFRLTRRTLAGPLIWSAHFGVSYGAQHVACETGRDGIVLPLVAAATIAALLALMALLARTRVDTGDRTQRTAGFYAALARALALLSVVGVLWVGAAIVFLPACATLR